jgi:Cu-Zn family superoxide dismutase
MKTSNVFSVIPVALALAALVVLAPGCNRSKDGGPAQDEGAERGAAAAEDAGIPAVVAVAELGSLGESGAAGRVIFTARPGGLETAVVADVQGLSAGEHGFHVHENGDCGDAGQAAGGHFNPAGQPHGSLTDAESHAGDLGNLVAGSDGSASKSFVTNKLSVGTGGANDVIGRAVIVHEKADDLASQPTGAAGGRIACGVITKQVAGDTPAR